MKKNTPHREPVGVMMVAWFGRIGSKGVVQFH